MYWIIKDFNREINTNDDKYIFYQILIGDKIDIREDIIYKLGLNGKIEDLSNKRKSEIIKINCNIKIKDSVIQYEYKIREREYCRTFLFNEEYTSEDNIKNSLKIPNIKYNYLRTDNFKMPNIMSKDYDYVYEDIEFEILPYSKNTLLIKQNGDIKKNFIITCDFKETKLLLRN